MAAITGGSLSPSRSGMWYWTIGAAVLIGGIIVTLVLLTRSSVASRPVYDPGQVSTAAKLALGHGQAMMALGSRMILHGRELQNDFWVSQGQHWVTDGDALIQRSRLLENLAAHIYGNNTGQGSVDLRALEGDAMVLKGHGQALVEHARVMKEFAALLQQRAQSAGDQRLLQDATDSLAQSTGMEQAGQQMLTAGNSLAEWVGVMQSSLGRSR